MAADGDAHSAQPFFRIGTKMDTFDLYRTFLTIAEQGSLSGAARALNRTPSAVSKQLSALEAQLGVTLVARTRHSLTLTAAGEAFQTKCRAIVQAVKDAERQVVAEHGNGGGEVWITLSKSLVHDRFFADLAAISERHPQIALHLDVSEDVRDLHEARFDIALRLGDLGKSSSLHAVALQEVQLVCCAGPDYVARHGAPASLQDLKHHRLILPPAEQLSQTLRRFFHHHDLQMDGRRQHTANDLDAVRLAIQHGMGLGFLLDITVAEELARGILVPVLEEVALPAKKLYMVTKADRYQPQPVRTVAAAIKRGFQHAPSRRVQGPWPSTSDRAVER